MGDRSILDPDRLAGLCADAVPRHGLGIILRTDDLHLRRELWQLGGPKAGWTLRKQDRWTPRPDRLGDPAILGAGLAHMARMLDQEGWPGLIW